MWMKLNESLAFGSTADTTQLRELAQQGYKTVIDLCASGRHRCNRKSMGSNK